MRRLRRPAPREKSWVAPHCRRGVDAEGRPVTVQGLSVLVSRRPRLVVIPAALLSGSSLSVRPEFISDNHREGGAGREKRKTEWSHSRIRARRYVDNRSGFGRDLGCRCLRAVRRGLVLLTARSWAAIHGRRPDRAERATQPGRPSRPRRRAQTSRASRGRSVGADAAPQTWRSCRASGLGRSV